MNWYYHDGKESVGPISDADFQARVAEGKITDTTLVWKEGMANWQPYGDLKRGAPAPQPPSAPGSTLVVEETELHYAGFWVRLLAKIIDGIITGAIGIVFALVIGLNVFKAPPTEISVQTLVDMMRESMVNSFLMAIPVALYTIGFNWRFGATPGKMILGLKVVRSDGSPIGLGIAAARYVAEWISGLVCYIGYIIAAFDNQKRTLHDHICGTRVVKL